MKKLLTLDQCIGKNIVKARLFDELCGSGKLIFGILEFADESALALKACEDEDGDEFLIVCDEWTLSESQASFMGLKTKTEREAEANAEREKRRAEFLKLKAEFEPS